MRAPPTPITNDQVREAVARAGTASGAAKLLGVTRSAVQQRMARMGIKADPAAVAAAINAGQAQGNARHTDAHPAIIAAMERAHAAGMTMRQAAEQAGVSLRSARKTWRRYKGAWDKQPPPAHYAPRQPKAEAPAPVIEAAPVHVEPSPELADARLARRHAEALAMLRKRAEPIAVASKTRLPLHEVYRLRGELRRVAA